MPALYQQWLYHLISSLSACEPGTSMLFVWGYDHKFTHTVIVFLIQTNRDMEGFNFVCVYGFLFIFFFGGGALDIILFLIFKIE